MHVKILSTRHTAIGTLRMGVIYALPENDRRVRAALEPMLKAKSPAAKVLTDEQVAAERAAVQSLALSPEEPVDTDAIDEIAELEARLTIADDDAAALKTRAETAEASVTSLTKEGDAATVKVEEQAKALEAAAETIANLQAALNAATVPAEDGTPKSAKPAGKDAKG